jgi:hypothetical protein
LTPNNVLIPKCAVREEAPPTMSRRHTGRIVIRDNMCFCRLETTKKTTFALQSSLEDYN